MTEGADPDPRLLKVVSINDGKFKFALYSDHASWLPFGRNGYVMRFATKKAAKDMKDYWTKKFLSKKD